MKRTIGADFIERVDLCYRDWLSRFSKCPMSDQWYKQIQYFTMYLLLSKSIHVFDRYNKDMYLLPFGSIKKNDRVILYGAGMVGFHIYDYLWAESNVNIVAWVDNKFDTLGNDNITSPQSIINLEYDYIIICVMMSDIVESIRKDLQEMNVPDYKVLWICEEYIENPMKLLSMVLPESVSADDPIFLN